MTRIGALFAGYGGLEHGVQAVLGGDVAWYSEIDKGALKILTHRYPDTPNIGDITTVDWTAVEPVDVLTGGFPCQDVSHAGKRAGMRPDTRTGLWSQMAYAIDQLRPALVVAENVRGLLSAEAHSDLEPCPWCMGDGTGVSALRALGAVLGDLADIGYDAAWYGLRAADVGAPHGRFRVFVVAYPQGDAGRLFDRDRQAVADRDGAGQRGDADGRSGADGPRATTESAPLFRTPTAQLAVNGGSQHPDKRKAGGHGPTLADEVEHLLPTPTTRDGKGRNQRDDETCLTGALLPTLTTCSYCGEPRTRERCDNCDAGPLPLLPTPRATDGTKGGPNQRGSSGDLMLPSAVQHLLPTPAVNDMGAAYTPDEWDAWTDRMKTAHGNGNGHGKSLSIEAQRLLPSPCAEDAKASGGAASRADGRQVMLHHAVKDPKWGDYADAIHRWGHTLGRPAPAPTITSSKGNPQLSPLFVEWMMGLPAGWVTDTPHITRNEALKALGNGVVPQQAEAALRYLLGVLAVAA